MEECKIKRICLYLQSLRDKILMKSCCMNSPLYYTTVLGLLSDHMNKGGQGLFGGKC